jgi:hypothetical protein
MIHRVAALLLLGLASLLPAHASRQVLQSGPGGCVAPPDNLLVQSGYNCVGVVQVTYDVCESVAQYQGSALPYIENTQNTVCYIPYGSDCPSSITILANEGNGRFTNCDIQTTTTAISIVETLLQEIAAKKANSGSSTAATTNAALAATESSQTAGAIAMSQQFINDNIAISGRR